MASQYGSVLPYIIININPGILVRGTNGINGANGKNGGGWRCNRGYAYNENAQMFTSGWFYNYISGGNGANGGNGNVAFDFNGLSGKTVVINNNGTIRGGNGGNGGTGGDAKQEGGNCMYVPGGSGGSGGSGSGWKANDTGVNLFFNGNLPQNGSSGVTGTTGFGYTDNSGCG